MYFEKAQWTSRGEKERKFHTTEQEDYENKHLQPKVAARAKGFSLMRSETGKEKDSSERGRLNDKHALRHTLQR